MELSIQMRMNLRAKVVIAHTLATFSRDLGVKNTRQTVILEYLPIFAQCQPTFSETESCGDLIRRLVQLPSLAHAEE